MFRTSKCLCVCCFVFLFISDLSDLVYRELDSLETTHNALLKLPTLRLLRSLARLAEMTLRVLPAAGAVASARARVFLDAFAAKTMLLRGKTEADETTRLRKGLRGNFDRAPYFQQGAGSRSPLSSVLCFLFICEGPDPLSRHLRGIALTLAGAGSNDCAGFAALGLVNLACIQLHDPTQFTERARLVFWQGFNGAADVLKWQPNALRIGVLVSSMCVGGQLAFPVPNAGSI